MLSEAISPSPWTAVSGCDPIDRRVASSFDGHSFLSSGRCTVRDAFDTHFFIDVMIPMNSLCISEYESHGNVV